MTCRTLIFAASLVVALQSTITPSQAVDLGGNCCADLEQRIAELERTSGRGGSRIFFTPPGAGGQFVIIDTTSFALENNALRFIGTNILNILYGSLSGSVATGSFTPPGQMNLGASPTEFASDGVPTVRSGIWGSALGGHATFDSNDLTPADEDFGGGIAGGHFRFAPHIALGAFAGGATSTFDTDRGKSIDADYVLGGVYGRAISGIVVVDGSVTAGHSDTHSERGLVTNLPGVPTFQTARADYDGAFAMPSVRVSTYIPMINGAVFVAAAEGRYIWQRLDGYSERGSSVDLTIDDRTLHSFEERFSVGVHQSLAGITWHANAGVVLYQRVGDDDVGVSLFGTSTMFDPGGPDMEAGVFARAGVDVEIAQSLALFADGEAQRTPDSEVLSGSAGLKLKF